MKLMTAILLLGFCGAAWAQNPDVIQDTRTTMKLVQQKKALDSDAALAASQPNASKPAPSQPAKAAPAKASPTSKPVTAPKADAKPASANPKSAARKSQPKQRIAVEDKNKPAQPKKQAEVINLTGRRDPFISPVVNRSMVGSGCSTGKRCMSIGEVNLKGVVKADTGMIAVVVNTMNKAYFLRENDPVFNGYVVKITGDSIIFKETLQDKLGKPFTREVTKKIPTPAV